MTLRALLSIPMEPILTTETRFSGGSLPVSFPWLVQVRAVTDVISVLTMKTRQGALGQFARVPADHLVLRPPNVTPVEAAGLTLAGLTAYQALFHIAHLEADQSVFISGGSTAVGAFAIQLAKAIGAKVIATASGRNEGFIRALGADEFMDYTQLDVPRYLAEQAPSPKFNVIFDAVGSADPSLYTLGEAYLSPNGIFVTTGPLPQRASVAEFWKLLKTLGAIITPRWLGGTKRAYKYVRPFSVSIHRLIRGQDSICG